MHIRCGVMVLSLLLSSALAWGGVSVTFPPGLAPACPTAEPTQLADGFLCSDNGTLYLGDDGGNAIAQGGATSSITLEGAKNNGNIVDNATTTGTSVEIGGTAQRLRVYEDATLGLLTRAIDVGTGNPLTINNEIFNGDPKLTILDNAGARDTCWTQDDTGRVTFNNAVESCGAFTGNMTVTGAVRGQVGVSTVSSNPYTMTANDCGTMVLIATGAGEVDLIADPTNGVSGGGCMICFYQVNAVTLLLDPNGTDTIDAAAATLALSAGDRLQLANVAGNQVCVLGTSASTWITLPGVGTLTDAN